MVVPIHVLMVEDSEDDAALICRELRHGGYEPTVKRVDSAEGMLVALNLEKWDLVICDYSMPHFSGRDALKLLRDNDSDIPFIFVSGTIGEDTAVAALKEGAQDYIMKDNFRRLIPAIQRELLEMEHRRQRKQLEKEVQQLQKFEAIGRLAGGLAHDFNNALGVIVGWAQLGYEQAPMGSSLRDKFQKIRDQAQRSAGLTSQLLVFARRQVLQPRNLDINKLVSETVGLLRSVVGGQIELSVSLTPDADVIRADPTQLDQVLTNLSLNARDAMPRGGRLLIETQNVEIKKEGSESLHPYGKPGRYVLLSVSDTGVGIDAATMDHIFEPFFTTKEIGKGTGLGLSTVYGIVKQHGGFVNVYSEPGQGATFRIYLPVASGIPDKQPVATNLRVVGGKETILVADDHGGIREVVQASLQAQGYRVILASDGQEAVRLFEASWEQIDLVLLDVVMPGLSGPDAYFRMCSIRPNLPVIFATGQTNESISLDSTVGPGVVFLKKPYAPEAVSQAIREKLDKHDAA